MKTSHNLAAFLVSSIASFTIVSCTQSADLEIEEEGYTEVNVELKAMTYEITRASDTSISDLTDIKRISVKVFDSSDNVVQEANQNLDDLPSEQTFGIIPLTLKLGTYTIVAVAHGVTNSNVGCATINSTTSVTLPETIVHRTFAISNSYTISERGTQTLTIDMGARKDAVLNVISTDNVQAGVATLWFKVNPNSQSTSGPTFNPKNGYANADYFYQRNLIVTPGQVINKSFSILLSGESVSYDVLVTPLNVNNTAVQAYTRTLQDVPFKIGSITTAKGYFFQNIVNGSFLFDTTTGSLDYNM